MDTVRPLCPLVFLFVDAPPPPSQSQLIRAARRSCNEPSCVRIKLESHQTCEDHPSQDTALTSRRARPAGTAAMGATPAQEVAAGVVAGVAVRCCLYVQQYQGLFVAYAHPVHRCCVRCTSVGHTSARQAQKVSSNFARYVPRLPGRPRVSPRGRHQDTIPRQQGRERVYVARFESSRHGASRLKIVATASKRRPSCMSAPTVVVSLSPWIPATHGAA